MRLEFSKMKIQVRLGDPTTVTGRRPACRIPKIYVYHMSMSLPAKIALQGLTGDSWRRMSVRVIRLKRSKSVAVFSMLQCSSPLTAENIGMAWQWLAVYKGGDIFIITNHLLSWVITNISSVTKSTKSTITRSILFFTCLLIDSEH